MLLRTLLLTPARERRGKKKSLTWRYRLSLFNLPFTAFVNVFRNDVEGVIDPVDASVLRLVRQRSHSLWPFLHLSKFGLNHHFMFRLQTRLHLLQSIPRRVRSLLVCRLGFKHAVFEGQAELVNVLQEIIVLLSLRVEDESPHCRKIIYLLFVTVKSCVYGVLGFWEHDES